jgi:NAD(P)-dependent dehydrogenase (short-subunit alcohol dehydrogenase family)
MSARQRRAAIVTGGAQGIGKATAQLLLREGYAVMIADVDDEAGREAEQELRALGDARYLRADVGSEDDVRRLVERTLAAFERLDALVNNAGIGVSKPIEELTLAEWNRVLATNLTGAFLCSKHAAAGLRAGGGAIVNIASTRALQSEGNTEAYSATKGGIVALTHALAISLAPQVRVNCVSPGWIDVSEWKKRSRRRPSRITPAEHAQQPVGRVGRPEDVAAMVVWLLSAQAGFVTGQNFVVDGGMTRKMIYV